MAGEWASEFAGPQTEDWQAEYDAELERLHGAQAPSAHGGYVMAENNPFLSDTDSMAKGWDLFKRVRIWEGGEGVLASPKVRDSGPAWLPRVRGRRAVLTPLPTEVSPFAIQSSRAQGGLPALHATLTCHSIHPGRVC